MHFVTRINTWLKILAVGCTWMNHVTFIFESCPTYECLISCHTYARVMSLTHVSRVTQMSHNAATDELHVRSVTQINRVLPVWVHDLQSCQLVAHEWVMSHRSMGFVTHVNKKNNLQSCQFELQKQIKRRIHTTNGSWMSIGTDMNESFVCECCPKKNSQKKKLTIFPVGSSEIDWNCTCMCDMTHLYVWHESLECVTYPSFVGLTRLIRMCDMAHSYVWHDSFMCATWLIHVCNTNHSYVWHICDMTRWNVRYHLFVWVMWFIHMCDMTHSCVWHDSFICVTWLSDVAHSYVWHASFICVTWLIQIFDTTHS